MKTEIGGDRLGSGSKESVNLKTYSRSTHDLSYLWRSSMAAGTLVPFMSEVALPGDNFEIDLNCEVMTLPTIGPLFGSYKVQLDIFECPMRLYNGKLHMNMLNIGMDMSQIKLPLINMEADFILDGQDDNEQINPSAIWSYLGVRGLGYKTASGKVSRQFNAVPYLSYWDIYKNYYANKQEEIGYVIHNSNASTNITITSATVEENDEAPIDILNVGTGTGIDGTKELTLRIGWNPATAIGTPDTSKLLITYGVVPTILESMFSNIVTDEVAGTIVATNFSLIEDERDWDLTPVSVDSTIESEGEVISLESFELDKIDTMRMNILADVASATAYEINYGSIEPYGLTLETNGGVYSKLGSQEGLGIKTYQSDLFNNWISTEWIDGTNGIAEITAVDTTGNEFTIDALNLANKVYNMLNRIAISGGSYDDWLSAVYTHERAKSTENPMYKGSLIKELGFEEVISTADTTGEQPLGTLAGRGRLTQKDKGGKIKLKINEPSYIMGIVSITPRIDYSQGNKWDVNLKTLDDLHKPALDEIGYQDLVTDQMAWFDTNANTAWNPTYKSAGKQPAWINYMTNVNQVRGNFADKEKEMFMTLNRRYERGTGTTGIDDLTTYIDPGKFNHIFADTNIDSQNFWVQISNKITARRKMSAKVIPNL